MQNNAGSVYANAGHIFYFANGVDQSFKEDVLNSSLYLQLAASNKHSRFDDFNAWRSVYVDAMPRFGWVPTGNRLNRQAAEGETSISVWEQISNSLGGRLSANLAHEVGRLFVDQEADKGVSTGLLLFRDHAVSVQTNSAAGQASAEEVSLSLMFSLVSCEHVVTSVFLAFRTTEPLEKNWLSQRFQTEKLIGDLTVEMMCAEISEHRYRRVRERLNTELGPRKQELIIRLDGGRP